MAMVVIRMVVGAVLTAVMAVRMVMAAIQAPMVLRMVMHRRLQLLPHPLPRASNPQPQAGSTACTAARNTDEPAQGCVDSFYVSFARR